MTVNNHLAYGLFSKYKFSDDGRPQFGFGGLNRFGALQTPPGMRPVSDFRRTQNPLLVMPFGPPQPWIVPGHEGAASSSDAPRSSYGRRRRQNKSLFGSILGQAKVNPSGYLATWYAEPRIAPTKWNPLLLQGANTFVQEPNSPLLSNVVTEFGRSAQFGKRRRTKRRSTKRKSGKSGKKVTKSMKREVFKEVGKGKSLKKAWQIIKKKHGIK